MVPGTATAFANPNIAFIKRTQRNGDHDHSQVGGDIPATKSQTFGDELFENVMLA